MHADMLLSHSLFLHFSILWAFPGKVHISLLLGYICIPEKGIKKELIPITQQIDSRQLIRIWLVIAERCIFLDQFLFHGSSRVKTSDVEWNYERVKIEESANTWSGGKCGCGDQWLGFKDKARVNFEPYICACNHQCENPLCPSSSFHTI